MSETNQPDPIRLVITLKQNADGTATLMVAGPTHNKLLCAHMIADALKYIMDAKISPLTVPAGRS